jgi:hypothetical protein
MYYAKMLKAVEIEKQTPWKEGPSVTIKYLDNGAIEKIFVRQIGLKNLKRIVLGGGTCKRRYQVTALDKLTGIMC